jgi:hypothetical protein
MLTLKAKLIDITYCSNQIILNLVKEENITTSISLNEYIDVQIPKNKVYLFEDKINEIVSVDIKIDCKLIYIGI